ncbi:hypothetical protein ONK27_29150, partial [Salmonella enterica subsp. enterica serovar Virginia]|nr:hypothetical protein [Salmonella enterica subsp. enterica serovar Virginia]
VMIAPGSQKPDAAFWAFVKEQSYSDDSCLEPDACVLVSQDLNATWSNARAEHNDRQQGWRAELSYSKTFTTGTNLVLAAYRY